MGMKLDNDKPATIQEIESADKKSKAAIKKPASPIPSQSAEKEKEKEGEKESEEVKEKDGEDKDGEEHIVSQKIELTGQGTEDTDVAESKSSETRR